MLWRDSVYQKGKEREPRLVQPTFYTVAQEPPTCTFGGTKELGSSTWKEVAVGCAFAGNCKDFRAGGSASQLPRLPYRQHDCPKVPVATWAAPSALSRAPFPSRTRGLCWLGAVSMRQMWSPAFETGFHGCHTDLGSQRSMQAFASVFPLGLFLQAQS